MQLTSEGYLESIKGSGTFVAQVLPEALLTAPHPYVPIDLLSREVESPQPLLTRRASLQIAVSQVSAGSPPTSNGLPRPFRSELPALDMFPYELVAGLPFVERAYLAAILPISRLLSSCVKRLPPMSRSRCAHCTPEQIIIVSGFKALDLTANAGQCWRSRVDGRSGYPGARHSWVQARRSFRFPSIIKFAVSRIERAPHARLVYTTPSHQFPLGVTMSLERRLALLEWAKHTDAYILEDDYDSEFRFAGRPLAALQGLDDAGRVIYIGTFSKVLFPALRIGYLILPLPLVGPFLTVRRLIDIHSPMLEQTVLTDFIGEGHFTRHLRRMRKLYAERRTAFLEAARELSLEVQSPPAGIHCIGWLPDGTDDLALASEASTHDLELTPVSDYCIEPLSRKGLLLGYGGFSLKEIKNGVRRLADLMHSS
jgi:GntR family transcriptional regulator/MocR family aminotransferase